MSDYDYALAHQRNSGSGIDDDPVRFWRVCSWCEEIMEEGDPGAPVSHGICRTCAEDVERVDVAGELARVQSEFKDVGRNHGRNS
jgi:hypothetical protein